MITILSQKAGLDGATIYEFVGLSTDTKPTGKLNGSTFFEMDTNAHYIYDAESDTWFNTGRTNYLVGASVTNPPTKTSYTAGEDLNPNGLQIKVSTKDSVTETITATTKSFNRNDLTQNEPLIVFIDATNLEAGQTEVTYTCNRGGISIEGKITGLTVTEPEPPAPETPETPGEG